MILILRIQAMKDKDSFVHSVIGNHDYDIVENYKYTNYVNSNSYNDYVGIKSSNKLFNSISNRNKILNYFIGNNVYTDYYMTYYLYIEYSSDKYIFLSHGSLCNNKIIEFNNTDQNDIDNFTKQIKNCFFSRSSLLECYLDGDKIKYILNNKIYDLYSIYFNEDETEYKENFKLYLDEYIERNIDYFRLFTNQGIETNLLDEIFDTTHNKVRDNLTFEQELLMDQLMLHPFFRSAH
jgi:hypothetical protein